MSDMMGASPMAGGTLGATPGAAMIAGVPTRPGAAPAINPADPYRETNRPRMLEVYKAFKEEALDSRWIFERLWWRNLLYTLGRQWIHYDRRTGQWTDKRMVKWVPRPVTNKIKDGADSLLSMFSSISLATTARPVGNDAENVGTAELIDLAAPFIHAEHRMDATFRTADLWNIITGNAFLFPHWDPDAQDGEIVIPFERCQACQTVASPNEISASKGVCATCGQSGFAPAVDDAGQPITDVAHTGRGRTLALSPFEVAVPHIYSDFESVPGALRLHWRPKRYYETFHPDLVKNLNFGKSPSDRSLQLLAALATQTDIQSRASFFGGSGTASADGIAEFELHLKPTKEFPEGLWLRAVGDDANTILESDTDKPGPLPYRTKQGEPIFTFIHLAYQPVPGRLLAASAVDPVIQKQDQINQLDAMMQLIVQRVSNPIWLEPKGVEAQSFTGEPGVVVRYNALAAGGAKPERLEGQNIPGTLFQLRQQYLDDFEQAMGTYDVLKGGKPSGVEAFSALQLLVERQQSRFTTVFNLRGEAYRKWFSIAIELERTYGPTERIIAVTRPNRGFAYRHFENARLQGSVEIHVEDGSQIPKTSLGRRAAIEQANNLRLINPADPEQQYAILQNLGLSDIMPSLDYNVKAALTQQDAFEEWAESPEAQAQFPMIEQAVAQFQQQQAQFQEQANAFAGAGLPMTAPPPVLPPMSPLTRDLWHKAGVHVIEHEKWANSDKARELFAVNPIIKTLFTFHYQEDLAAQQAEAMAAAGPAPGGPGQAPGVGRALQQSNQESGSTADVPSGQGEGAQNAGPR